MTSKIEAIAVYCLTFVGFTPKVCAEFELPQVLAFTSNDFAAICAGLASLGALTYWIVKSVKHARNGTPK